MGKSKKINPNRKPCTEAEANKKADEAFQLAIAIMMSTLADDGVYDEAGIKRIWEKINYKADSIKKGYINLFDLVAALEDEHGIGVAGVKTR